MKQINKAPQEDDAMFTKRYVGPANCASCEKGIVNLIGQPVDYHAWKRLPFREPSERIARVSSQIDNSSNALVSILVRSRFLQDPHDDASE